MYNIPIKYHLMVQVSLEEIFGPFGVFTLSLHLISVKANFLSLRLLISNKRYTRG